jgi:hypothetical protein
MKGQIRQKDSECVQAHLQRKVVETALVRLGVEIIELERGGQEMQQKQCTLKNQLARTRYLRDVAETDIIQQDRITDRFEIEQRALEGSIHRRTFEGTLLKEKARVLESLIRSEANAFVVIVNQAETLHQILLQEIEKRKFTEARSQHLQALRLERLRLEKQCLLAKGKAKAPEDELETPMHVHRWRFIEGTNPELIQLIRMTQALRGRYMIKVATLERLKMIVCTLQHKIDSAVQHLTMMSCHEHKEALHTMREMIDQKKLQLQRLDNQIAGQRGYVEDSRSNVAIVKGQLRDITSDYLHDKQASTDLYKRIVQKSGEDMKPLFQTTRFVGGGFPVSAFSRRSIDALLIAARPSEIISRGDCGRGKLGEQVGRESGLPKFEGAGGGVSAYT